MLRAVLRSIQLPALLCGVALTMVLVSCAAPGSNPLAKGRQLPSFELVDLAGGRLATEELRGEITVINFWATWCSPCRREIPALREVGKQTRVIAITLDDPGNQAAVRKFIGRERINYTVLQGDQVLANKLGVRSIPYTVIVDAELQIVAAYRGVVRERTLRKAIHKATQIGAST